ERGAGGASVILRDATIAEMDQNGTTTVLREGKNGWICIPGNENIVGDPPMCVDELGMQWLDAASRHLRTVHQDCVICSAGPRNIATTLGRDAWWNPRPDDHRLEDA